jgi:hypothetical protein
MAATEFTAKMLAARIADNAALQDQVRADPAKAVGALADEIVRSLPPALQSDPWVYRMVVLFLGCAVIISLVGATVLVYSGGEKTPDILTAIGSAAVGALAGLLAPAPAARPAA